MIFTFQLPEQADRDLDGWHGRELMLDCAPHGTYASRVKVAESGQPGYVLLTVEADLPRDVREKLTAQALTAASLPS